MFTKRVQRTEEVTVSREHVGGLIGSKGSSIRAIQEASGATVRVEPAKRGTMPSMVVTGSRAQIDSAKRLIHEKVDQIVRAELWRAAWVAGNKAKTREVRQPSPKNESKSTPLRNMFHLLEGLPDGSNSTAEVMGLDEYMLTQKRGITEAVLQKKRTARDAGLEHLATARPPTKRPRTEASPGVKLPARDTDSKSLASGSSLTKKNPTAFTFRVGQKPKIGMLKYQNFLEAMKRKEFEASAASDDDRPSSTLSADAAEFVMPNQNE